MFVSVSGLLNQKLMGYIEKAQCITLDKASTGLIYDEIVPLG